MVRVAAKAGADFIKFQTFSPSALVTDVAAKVDYQKRTTGQQGRQRSMLERLELSRKDFVSIKKECQKNKIGFLSTAFDPESLKFVESLRPTFHKVSSGDVDNLAFLRQVASYGRPVLLSTGMATLWEVKSAVATLIRAGLPRQKIVVLQCHTDYPTRPDDVNLRAMDTIRENCRVRTGLSDHTQGIAVSLAAVARGAAVLEKHFTLDCAMPGPDHRASIPPEELNRLVYGIREVEAALGDGIKKPSQAEKKTMPHVRKKLVALRTIQKGERFTSLNLGCKRTSGGISAAKIEMYLGKKAQCLHQRDQAILP